MIQTTIRIEDELHEDLRQTAFNKKISINQEIILRLESHKDMISQVIKMTKRLQDPNK